MRKILKFLKKRKYIVIITALIVVYLLFSVFFSKDKGAEIQIEDNLKKIEASSVKDIISENSNLNLVGRVESESESKIKTESQGEISVVYKKLGDQVFAGEIIAEIENSVQRAEVLNAEASLDIAKANLEKLKDSSGDNVVLIKSSIRQSFTTTDDAIRNRVDQLFENPDGRFPNLQINFGDYFRKKDIEDLKYEIELILEDWKEEINNISNLNNVSEIEKIINSSQDRIRIVEGFLDELAFALSLTNPNTNVTQNDIDKYKNDISVARNSISNSLSSLINSFNNLNSSVDFGDKGQDIIISEANVEQARARLLITQSNLEKTIIRSPITGEINSIDIKKGSFVSSFQDVVEVVGGNNVVIKSFVTENEINKLKIGTEVIIDKKYKGKISRIAPSVNSETQKIEIIIIPTESVKLKNGQSINVSIVLDDKDFTEDLIIIPIKSIRINTDGNFVLSVNSSNEIYFKPVKIGEIIGDSIIIEEGLESEDIIIIDARGLKEGQVVNLN